MIILGLSGVILFAVSVAALAAPESWQVGFFHTAWKGLSFNDKEVIQVGKECAGQHFPRRCCEPGFSPGQWGEPGFSPGHWGEPGFSPGRWGDTGFSTGEKSSGIVIAGGQESVS